MRRSPNHLHLVICGGEHNPNLIVIGGDGDRLVDESSGNLKIIFPTHRRVLKQFIGRIFCGVIG